MRSEQPLCLNISVKIFLKNEEELKTFTQNSRDLEACRLLHPPGCAAMLHVSYRRTSAVIYPGAGLKFSYFTPNLKRKPRATNIFVIIGDTE